MRDQVKITGKSPCLSAGENPGVLVMILFKEIKKGITNIKILQLILICLM